VPLAAWRLLADFEDVFWDIKDEMGNGRSESGNESGSGKSGFILAANARMSRMRVAALQIF
jgi:hypothetical protein